VEKQRTLASSASLSGSALHTGENVTLTILPAPAGHGFKFQRTDLPDDPVVDASASHVKTVERATTLVQGMVKIHTVEHVLSALVGMGVDNALIQMDANEPPIGDGSAGAYVELIKKAGIVEQDAPRRYIDIQEPLNVEINGSLLVILPDSKFRVSCTQAGPEGRFTQFLSAEITPEFYEKEIAPARTFVFYEDVKPLMDKGLIKGGSLENAIVARGESVLSKEPLRFPDEFVRHKILDIVGDLALCGRFIRGHVIAVKPGHGINTEAAKKLLERTATVTAGAAKPVSAPTSGALDINAVMNILPHRYPFLMVDRIIDFDGGLKATGVKAVTINEPYFQGHFPGHPVMPGVLQLEAMAQVASIVMMRRTENDGKIGYFMSADEVKFRKPVMPGDTLFIECELTSAKKRLGKAACRCLVNGEVVSEGILLFGLIDK
jgi:UDP-3-O-[3-hydroxymyristoyl] N-acetylglucosamine deacetylase/3-hydroxyacyl-[acyl-carrier-protein] dehydratase